MKTIVLLGELGRRFGRRHQLDVASPAEAVRALCANFKDFRGFVSTSHERNVAYRVVNVADPVTEEQLHHPAGHTITFAPVIAGAGGSGLGSIFLGAALIGLAFVLPVAPLIAGIAGSSLASISFGIGVAMALGGVAQLLAPPPKPSGGNQEQEPSYVFDGAINTTSQGYPVPLGYGRLIVGSAVISAGISAEDISE